MNFNASLRVFLAATLLFLPNESFARGRGGGGGGPLEGRSVLAGAVLLAAARGSGRAGGYVLREREDIAGGVRRD